MVVLAASIVTKTGKGARGALKADLNTTCLSSEVASVSILGSCTLGRVSWSDKRYSALVSRQFVDMTRIRIEGLLAAFPKLVGNGKQHTYVETDNVRYVYQPMEGLYLLLVTNKSSNILEDLETLRLLSKVVPEYIHPVDEEGVCLGAFDLIFAFDEVISMGHKENITVVQVKQNTDMESHEEKLHKMIIQSKINDTKDVMKRKAMEIDKLKLDRDAKAREGRAAAYVPSSGAVSAGRSPMAMDINTPTYSKPEPSYFGKAEAKKGPSKGMQLGKAKKGANDFLDSLRAEGEMVQDDVAGDSLVSAGPAVTQIPTDPVSIAVEEKLHVVLNKNGGLEDMEVNGTVFLQALSEEDAFVRVAVESGPNKGFNFKTHPNIDKQLYGQQNLLGLKDPERPFPIGSPVGILKWRMQTRDPDAEVPLSINCWPSTSGGESYVNIEYECTVTSDLQDVTIAIPLPPLSSAPRINQARHPGPPAFLQNAWQRRCEDRLLPQVDGDTHYDSRKSQLLWTIDLLDDSNRSGSLEFVVPATSADTFFPVEVNFASATTLCQIAVKGVSNTRSGAPVKYGITSQLSTDGYEVV